MGTLRTVRVACTASTSGTEVAGVLAVGAGVGVGALVEAALVEAALVDVGTVEPAAWVVGLVGGDGVAGPGVPVQATMASRTRPAGHSEVPLIEQA